MTKTKDSRLWGILDDLTHEGDELLEQLGCKRQANGRFKEIDNQILWDLAVKNGMPWLRDYASRAASGNPS